MEINDVSGQIVDAAFHIHQELGPGLLESVYEPILAHVLQGRGLDVQRQVAVPLKFSDLYFPVACRVDLLVEGAVAVELKSVETIAPVHPKQLRTYLKLLDCRLGLLINFGAPLLKDGVTRIANNL